MSVLLTVLAASSFWFQTPSHNIACIGDSKSIRCDTRFVTKYSQPRYKPKGCDVAYGTSKLYGGKFRCSSRTSGLRCQNRSGHGFFISRQRQSIF